MFRKNRTNSKLASSKQVSGYLKPKQTKAHMKHEP